MVSVVALVCFIAPFVTGESVEPETLYETVTRM